MLFIAHGNHEITTESYLGYDYLGRYLASHGYVMVSVDQNACNMLTGENAGRAVLLLEHIGLQSPWPVKEMFSYWAIPMKLRTSRSAAPWSSR